MTTIRSTLGDDCARANNVDFSRDSAYFCVALARGFSIYHSATCELYLNEDLGRDISIAVMLESSQILGLVDAKHPANRRLTLFDCVARKEVASIVHTTRIKHVVLSTSHIAVACDRTLHLYKHEQRIVKIAEYDTAANPLGLCSLGGLKVVFPGRSPGHIQVVDTASMEVTIIPAHTSALRALQTSTDGAIVVSGSQNGTLLRVFSTKTSAILAELRRGVVSAGIYSLAVSLSGKKLAVTSDTSTLHIFDMPESASLNLVGTANQVNIKDASSSRSNKRDAHKWGLFARLPFAPKVLTDNYSVASTQFDPGSAETRSGGADPEIELRDGRARKGVIGWFEDSSLAIISAGSDARYERYSLVNSREGSTVCVRDGWSKFLKPN